MHINEGYLAGVHQVQPSGTNSTMFTQCCDTAICDDQPNCPNCKRKIVGYNANSSADRGRIRWRFATSHWKRS